MIETTLENLHNDYDLLVKRLGSQFEVPETKETSSFEDAWDNCMKMFHQDSFSKIYEKYHITDIDSYLIALKPAIAAGAYYIGHDYRYRKAHEKARSIYQEFVKKKEDGICLNHTEGHIKNRAKEMLDSEKINPSYYKKIHGHFEITYHEKNESDYIIIDDLINRNRGKYSAYLKGIASADSFLVNPYLFVKHPSMYSGALIAYIRKIHQIDEYQLDAFSNEELSLLSRFPNNPEVKKEAESSRDARTNDIIQNINWKRVINLLPLTTAIIQSASQCLDGHSQLDNGKISAKRLQVLSDTVSGFLKYNYADSYCPNISDDTPSVELPPTCSAVLNAWAADELFRLPRISSAFAFYLTYTKKIQESPDAKLTQNAISLFCTSILQIPTMSLRRKLVSDYKKIANAFAGVHGTSDISSEEFMSYVCKILLINNVITPIFRVLVTAMLFCRCNSVATDEAIHESLSSLEKFINENVTTAEFSADSPYMWSKDNRSPSNSSHSYIWDDKDYFISTCTRMRSRETEKGQIKTKETGLEIKTDFNNSSFEEIFKQIINQNHKWNSSDIIWKLKLTQRWPSATDHSILVLFDALLLEASYSWLPEPSRTAFEEHLVKLFQDSSPS